MDSTYAHSTTTITATRLGANLRNMFINVINHRETNFIITSFIIFASLYASLTAIFERSLLHPLTITQQKQQIVYPPQLSLTPSNHTLEEKIHFEDFPFSSPFRQCRQLNSILNKIYLPSLAGPLIVGCLIANFGQIRELLTLPNSNNGGTLIVEIAFLVVIIRAMLGINSSSLLHNLSLICLLGILCPLIECLIILLAATLLFKINLSIALLFGFAISASSPPVIVPTIKRLEEKQFTNNDDSGIPTIILFSTILDNIFALAGFGIAFEAMTTKYEQLSYTLSRIPGELLIGAIIGISAGFLLRFFPRPDAHLVHFTRVLILLSVGSAFHFGAREIGCVIAGPTAVLIMTLVAAINWQIDNRRGTRTEENGLRLFWELVASPLLFLLFGSLLDFTSIFSSTKLLDAFLFLLLSLLVRLATGLACTFCCSTGQRRTPSERLFISLAILPKGSLQLIIAPAIVCFHMRETGRESVESGGILLSLETILLALLFCSPIGEMLLRLLGPLLLRRRLIPNACVVPLGEPYKKGGLMVAHSDPWDNRLRLELGPIDPADPQIHKHTAYPLEGTNKLENDSKP
uniref:Cation/H+ exchanger domain-containing protein n=2 Tax=Meloidogyne TaxID=189290 RepID=A0A915NZ23_9BILA